MKTIPLNRPHAFQLFQHQPVFRGVSCRFLPCLPQCGRHDADADASVQGVVFSNAIGQLGQQDFVAGIRRLAAVAGVGMAPLLLRLPSPCNSCKWFKAATNALCCRLLMAFMFFTYLTTPSRYKCRNLPDMLQRVPLKGHRILLLSK